MFPWKIWANRFNLTNLHTLQQSNGNLICNCVSQNVCSKALQLYYTVSSTMWNEPLWANFGCITWPNSSFWLESDRNRWFTIRELSRNRLLQPCHTHITIFLLLSPFILNLCVVMWSHSLPIWIELNWNYLFLRWNSWLHL